MKVTLKLRAFSRAISRVCFPSYGVGHSKLVPINPYGVWHVDSAFEHESQ